MKRKDAHEASTNVRTRRRARPCLVAVKSEPADERDQAIVQVEMGPGSPCNQTIGHADDRKSDKNDADQAPEAVRTKAVKSEATVKVEKEPRQREHCTGGGFGGSAVCVCAPVKKEEPAHDFAGRVLQVVQAIPRGYVLGYGMVAALAGLPRNARQVGSLLSTGLHCRWQRVISSSGAISLSGAAAEQQRALLLSEGVSFCANGRVGAAHFWRPSEDDGFALS